MPERQGTPCDFFWQLKADELSVINQAVISAVTPGEPVGIRDHNLLSSCAMAPAVYRYRAQREDVFEMAAALGEKLVNFHVFLNGNKRTAYAAVYLFLRCNGFTLSPQVKTESVLLFQGLADSEYNAEDLANWLYVNSQPSHMFNLDLSIEPSLFIMSTEE